MLRKVRRDWLPLWLDRADLANVTYFRVRRALFQELAQELRDAAGVHPGLCVTLPDEVFLALKQLLQSRNEGVSSDVRLSFERALADCSMLLQPISQVPEDFGQVGQA